MSADPVRLVRDALEARGFPTRGKAYDFRSKCPAHDGDNSSSLHVQIGADGRCVVYCFAHHCSAGSIAAALGLRLQDLFPDDHRDGPRRRPAPIRRTDFTGSALHVANVLYILEKAREPWALSLVLRCPSCGSPGAWLRATQAGADVDCAEGCNPKEFIGLLLHQLHERSAA